MTGDQPDGIMQVTHNDAMLLPGFEKGAILVHYRMNNGVRNAVPFAGTTRTAYLPNNK